MIDFRKFDLSKRQEYMELLRYGAHRGVGFAFVNLCIWGHQRCAVVDGTLVMFSHYNGHTMYPFPAGPGDMKPILDAILADAAQRGIPCRISGVTERERELLEAYYPGAFRLHWDRDSYDYVYDIQDLAELKGKRFQPKRNHVNRFLSEFPDAYVRELDELTLPDCMAFTDAWFARREEEDPKADFQMERQALCRAYRYFRELGMEGLVLYADGRVAAMTMGSFLSEDTVDVHFEKADGAMNGAYAAINRAFARYIRDKYPQVKYLNREEDMGSPGLRKAKLSYHPHHLVEKCWAHYTGEGFND